MLVQISNIDSVRFASPHQSRNEMKIAFTGLISELH